MRKLQASLTTDSSKNHHRFHVFYVLLNLPSEHTAVLETLGPCLCILPHATLARKASKPMPYFKKSFTYCDMFKKKPHISEVR